MKNLRPLRLNYVYYRNIAGSKRLPLRGQLLAIGAVVQRQYSSYVYTCLNGDLFAYTVSAFGIPDTTNLSNCYSDTKQVKVLKSRIYDNQDAWLRFDCPYCLIGDSSESFDHYLPQTVFPEFSILSNNLIPCCSKCNSIKSDQWKDLGATRNILNFYYDPIPAQQFLQCSIAFRRNTPRVQFSIINPGAVINAPLFRIIERHYQRLGLIERFKQKSNSEITNVANTMRQLIGVYTRAQASQFLLEDATQMKLSYGNNYWKALLKEAMANSVPFLISIGF